MTTEVNYKEDDTVPLEAILPVDLTDGLGVDYVEFEMEHVDTGTLVSGNATILDYKDGRVAYEFDDTDVAENGMYHMEWDVHWNNGDKKTYPGDGFDKLLVHDTLDN